MKSFLFILCLVCSQNLMANEAPTSTLKVQSKDLYIDGTVEGKSEVVSERVEVEDDELKFFKNELENVKNLNKSFKQKSKTLAKMAEEAEQLKEQHLDYIENRVEWESTIDEYNQQANCMSKNPKDCTKFLGKDRKKKRGQRDESAMNNTSGAQTVVPGHMAEMPVSFDSELEMGMMNDTREEAPRFDQRAYIQGIDSVIAANADLLGDCLSRYATGTNDFSVVYAQLSLTTEGNLSHLGIENPESVPNRKVLSCVSSVLHSLAYPTAAKNMKVRKPFSFVIRRS